MTEYREADFSRLKTVSIARRPNKVDPSLLGHPPGRDKSFAAFWRSLPDILAAQDLPYVADQIARPASPKGRARLAAPAVSVLRAAAAAGVPVTVHATVGADITHQHPTADGAALGATSHRDLKRLAAALPALHDGGVVLNLGSAVVMPEVFLKALTVARNLNGGKPT